MSAWPTRVEIPYPAIRSIRVGEFVPPPGLWKVAGTRLPGSDLYEGSFRVEGRRYFLSLEDVDSTVTLEVEAVSPGAPPFEFVVFETPDPHQDRDELHRRVARLPLRE